MKKRSMSKLKRPVLPLALLVLTLFCRSTFAQEYAKPKVSTAPADARTIVVNLVALEQCIHHNRLGAKLPEGQIYALANDGYFPAVLARVHPTFRTPFVAILLQTGAKNASAALNAPNRNAPSLL